MASDVYLQIEGIQGESTDDKHGSGLLPEIFELRYTKFSEKYVQRKVGGGTGGNTAASWNLATNKAT